MRRIIDLNGSDWRFGSVAQKPFGDVNDLGEVSEWLPAQVPGDVRLDLLRAGKIADPCYGTNNEESQWVDTLDWWYTRDLDLTLQPDERAFLVFEGIDYQSAVFVNGIQLGRHVGMFSRQIYELQLPTSNLQFLPQTPRDRGAILVRVWGSDSLPKMRLSLAQKLWSRVIARLLKPNEPFPDRYATVKCQMQFGWDFAPRLRTCGIWDDAYVVVTKSVFIQDAWVRSQVTGRKSQVARIQLDLTLDSAIDQTVRAVVNIHGKNFDTQTQTFQFHLDLTRGTQTHQVTFDLQDARVWNPWDRGEPNLYEIQVQLFPLSSPEFLDSFSTSFGIRSFELAALAPHAEPWTFVINGKREFIRGANWVPIDAIPGRVTREDYAELLHHARAANINLLRVWGGGLREKRAFYDLCDEMGILVWQEFPFSGNLLTRFPRNADYLRLVRRECAAIVYALRNHPALVLWCGGNEFSPSRNAHLVNTLREIVATRDSTRPFKPASPSPGESHNWRVWHGYFNTRDYRKDKAVFFGEFGLQAPPSPEALAHFIPRDALWPPGKTWEYHNAEIDKLRRYARAIQAHADSLEPFVQAAQMAQLRGLQIAIEHARRNKPRVSGCIFWQFNEPWPSINWSIVDYRRQFKPSYHKIKQIYDPILISFEYEPSPRSAGQIVRGDLWLVNDTLNTLDGEIVGVHNGERVSSHRARVGPNVSENIGALAVKLSDVSNELLFQFIADSRVLATNEYDLVYCDAGNLNLFDALKMTAISWLK